MSELTWESADGTYYGLRPIFRPVSHDSLVVTRNTWAQRHSRSTYAKRHCPPDTYDKTADRIAYQLAFLRIGEDQRLKTLPLRKSLRDHEAMPLRAEPCRLTERRRRLAR